MSERKTKGAPDETDEHVGARVRKARIKENMSQAVLGEKIGVTFQQIQKYEAGTNRLSAGRLFRASKALNRHIAWFFPGYED